MKGKVGFILVAVGAVILLVISGCEMGDETTKEVSEPTLQTKQAKLTEAKAEVAKTDVAKPKESKLTDDLLVEIKAYENYVLADVMGAHKGGAFEPDWRLRVGGTVLGAIAVAGERVYFGDAAGVLHCADRRTGQAIASFNAHAPIHASPRS